MACSRVALTPEGDFLFPLSLAERRWGGYCMAWKNEIKKSAPYPRLNESEPLRFPREYSGSLQRLLSFGTSTVVSLSRHTSPKLAGRVPSMA